MGEIKGKKIMQVTFCVLLYLFSLINIYLHKKENMNTTI